MPTVEVAGKPPVDPRAREVPALARECAPHLVPADRADVPDAGAGRRRGWWPWRRRGSPT
ncbi:MAG: hypothetical protein ACRDP3_12555 [Streptomyces sp.]|uniref:hypothetical protein n=1 Tax=Streptomyces sp. TaxID=1931 RepID=UPI003D6B673C